MPPTDPKAAVSDFFSSFFFFLPNPISEAINVMDLCMSAPLEFAVMLGAGCVPAVMQQGEIYEGAGEVFWQEKRCVTIAAGPHWGLFSIPAAGMQAFLTLLLWLVVDITCPLGTKRSHVSTIRL